MTIDRARARREIGATVRLALPMIVAQLSAIGTNVVDAVLLWWRDEDGDLVDALVDALTDLADGGSVCLLTPKVGRPGAVEAADITEAAPIAGLAVTTTLPICADWTATRLAAPKNHPR